MRQSRIDRRKLARAEAVAAAQSAMLSNFQDDLRKLTAEQQQLNNLYRRLREQQQDAQDRAEKLEKDIQQARVQLADADTKFSIVPYDGDSGTTRRPLIIECTEHGLTFASEGMTLTPADLDGFTPRYNPLLYVTQALSRYWQRRERTSSSDELGEPYLLLVVRPGGTIAYYVARALLAGMRDSFGYELVADDQDFIWPESDPEAKEICRLIVERMLAERDELAEVAVTQGARLSDFSDGQGRFRLKEIDRLKNPHARGHNQRTTV